MGNVFSDADEPAATPSVNDTNVDCRQFLKDGSGRVTEHFERVRDLGEGAYGEVFLARQRVAAGTAEEHSGRLVAVKRVRKPNPGVGLDEEGADSQQSLEEFRLEVDLMKSLDHPCICRLLQVYEDPKNLYIVMEHIEGGELFEHVVEQGNFSEHDAARVIRQVSSSLEYCHDRGVVHRDIKPENIMVVSDDADSDEVTVKLIDFGFGSRILSGVKLKARVGTFVYTAPEAFKDEPCDEKLDMWALGCVLFVLLSGDAPFFGADCQSKIIQGSFSMEGWDAVSDSAKDLIRGLLEVDPSKRLSAAEVLQHAWLQKAAPHLKASANSLDQMHALEAFHKQSLFRHLAAGVLAKQLDERLLHDLHSTFCSIDKDENGVISFGEFKQVLRDFNLSADSHKDLEPGAGKIADVFHSVDMDGRGSIDYTEFVAACLDRKVEDEEGICWSAFEVFDKDGSGLVTYDELEQVLNAASMQQTFPEEVRKRLWEELTGADGAPQDVSVDFDHFLAALRGVRLPRKEKASQEAKKPKTDPISQPSSGGLPIARRHQGAVASMGLPIKSRAAELPISSRAANTNSTAGGLGLPISSRH